MSEPRVLAVHAGAVRPLPRDPAMRSGYAKSRCEGAVRVSRAGLAGDEQASPDVHGGVDRAVLFYAAAHYERWRAEDVALEMGAFAENLTVAGLDEDAACIGDVVRVGGAVLEVSLPRVPCATIERATGVPGLLARVQSTGRFGWLARVVREGELREGDAVELLERPFPEWTVARASRVYERMRAEDAAVVDDARALAMVPSLAARWREKLLERVSAAAQRAAGRSLPDHVARNREAWDAQAADYVAAGERHWAVDEPEWGIWSIPEREAGVLPEVLAGRRAIELGCGTAYVSSWLARRGASVVGIDNSPRQLATARRLQREHGVMFPVLLGNAEEVPFPDASFDLAISEYGASIWADPYKWVPEAARLLRPGGELIFLVNGTLAMLTLPATTAEGPAGERLLRPYFGLHRVEWADETSVEFHLGYGDWIRLLRSTGFEVTDLIELRPGEGASTRYTYVTVEWARRWPAEQVWKARKKG